MVAARWRTICRTSGRCMTIRASSVTSRALETCPGASSPSGRAKWVLRRPSSLAFAFIIATKRCWFPCPTCRASASAASLALWISAASSSSRTVSRSPGRRFALDSPTCAANGLTSTVWLGRACSSVSRTVISFVMLAIGTRSRALRANRTSPVTPFSTMNARPLTCGGAASTGAASTRLAARAISRGFKRRRVYCSLDPDPLADDEVGRLDARVEREQLLDARVELDRDVAQRLAGAQLVEAAAGRRHGRRVDGGGRADGRPRACRRSVGSQARPDEQHGDRDREQERRGSAVPLRVAPPASRHALPAGDGPDVSP